MAVDTFQIGKLVLTELERQGKSVQWLAEQINTSVQNCYKMMHATSLHTDTLRHISVALNHNFFADLASLMEQPDNKLLLTSPIPDFHDQFYAMVEPFLKQAGYKGRIKNGVMTVWIGDPKIEIHHHMYTAYPEKVSLVFPLKDERFKEMHWLGYTVLVNELALTNPHWNISCDFDKKLFLARYTCYLYQPNDLIEHLDNRNYDFCNLYDNMQCLLPQILKDFPKD